jgi:hypothetical protein
MFCGKLVLNGESCYRCCFDQQQNSFEFLLNHLHKVTRENLWEKTVRIKDLSLLWNLLLREIFVSIFRQQAVRWLKKSEEKNQN